MFKILGLSADGFQKVVFPSHHLPWCQDSFFGEVKIEDIGLPPSKKERWSNKALYSWAYHHTSVVGKRMGLEAEVLKANCRNMGRLAVAKWL